DAGRGITGRVPPPAVLTEQPPVDGRNLTEFEGGDDQGDVAVRGETDGVTLVVGRGLGAVALHLAGMTTLVKNRRVASGRIGPRDLRQIEIRRHVQTRATLK